MFSFRCNFITCMSISYTAPLTLYDTNVPRLVNPSVVCTHIPPPLLRSFPHISILFFLSPSSSFPLPSSILLMSTLFMTELSPAALFFTLLFISESPFHEDSWRDSSGLYLYQRTPVYRTLTLTVSNVSSCITSRYPYTHISIRHKISPLLAKVR